MFSLKYSSGIFSLTDTLDGINANLTVSGDTPFILIAAKASFLAPVILSEGVISISGASVSMPFITGFI